MPDRAVAVRAQLPAQVAGPAREVERRARRPAAGARGRFGGATRRPCRTSSRGSRGRSARRSRRTARGRGPPSFSLGERLGGTRHPPGSRRRTSARVASRSAASPTLSMWASATRAARGGSGSRRGSSPPGSSSSNASTSCCGGRLVGTRRVADRLAHVLVEQLDGALGEPDHRASFASRASASSSPSGSPNSSNRSARAHHLDVGGRVALLAVDRRGRADALALDGLDQRRGNAARLRELLQGEELLAFVGAGASRSDRRGQIGVRRAELARRARAGSP